ncbi:hypothetical protein EC973_006961 [Apophysomyces ossiformis]|uniref:Uncharacterized protein n=1 Tax=Apophysomyces ossiformis TaxID=679940 RepID=A0A8H7ER96_9FUNG|nr:hypothetical protein EC973_006961 [Apophysomyces ossiformis]
MGQGTSNLHQNLTFGYLASPSTILPDEEDNHLILTNPHLYGLVDKSTSHASSKFSTSVDRLARIDSGYCNDEKERLVKDLVYVDKTYYENIKPKHPRSETIASHNGASRLTFANVVFDAMDKPTQDINLSFYGLRILSPNVGLLTMIRKLDLSHNCLSRLPNAIGHLYHLEILSLSHNALTEIPDTLSYLPHLLELDLSFNRIDRICPCIGYLKKLHKLQLCNNQIFQLPVELVGMTNITTLDVSLNPLQTLPAEILQLPYLRRLRMDSTNVSESAQSLIHDPPSLVESCCRAVIRCKISTKGLPQHLIDYLALAKSCSFCYRPYFDAYVTRQRLVEKCDLLLRLEYRLCSAHWTDDHDRMLSLFCEQPLGERVPIPRPNLLPLLPRRERRAAAVFKRRPRQSLSSTVNDYLSSSEEEDSSSRLVSSWRLQPKKVMSKNHTGFLNLKRAI